jgi:hypothetical protein
MNLPDFLNTLTTVERKAFAEGAGIDDKYLAQLKCSAKASGDRFPSLAVCKKFVDLSGGKLTIEELRPDIFGGAASTEAA